jgi:bifunctional aspartokinase / homoserine dehydrogenase 1
MSRTEVHKFGGTSVGDARRIASAASLMVEAAKGCRLVVVSSAMSGVTDALIEAAESAAEGERGKALVIISDLLEQHERTLDALVPEGAEDVRAELRELTTGVTDVLRAVSHLHLLSPRTRDVVLSIGEKLAVRLLAAAMRRLGAKAVRVDGDTLVDTDDVFGEATPLPGISGRGVAAGLCCRLDAGEIPVLTGFVGRAPDGATTTLGRGGSDYSATIVAEALAADEVTIWTDVDGVYTADPRVVPEAHLLRQLNYREAAELSYYGAKILHPRTILPVTKREIPVRIRNSFRPEVEGTWVDAHFTPGSHPVKAISAVRAQALVSVEGKGMAGIPGIAARMFGALADRGISVTMISQSSSESSICFAVANEDAEAAELALKRVFRGAIASGDVEEIVVQRHVGLIAIVGLGMAHSPGVSGRLFGALGARGVNVLAIAQGSSELNISLAVERRQVDEALRAIHEQFELHRLDTGEDTTGRLDILLFGCGSIGRALCEMVLERRAHVFERFHLEPRIVALCDRSGYLFRPNGIPMDELRSVLEAKAGGTPLCQAEGATASTDPSAMLHEALQFRLARPILVDVSDADASLEVMREAFRLGCDVATANKKPLAGSYESYRLLREEAASLGRVLKAEATVGAGLPVMDTLETMVGSGDQLTSAQGCLSGTLAFVLSKLEAGVPMSQAVEEAMAAGFTEPDPMVDLCGADVGRKAVILGRVSGLAEGDVPLQLTGLVDGSWVGLAPEDWRERVLGLDDEMRARVEQARLEGKVLRFVATVKAGQIEVGPVAVEADSALGMLRGTDNMIVFQSERYDTRPLVVSGPGAGVDVTAMGVMGDILRIAAERR